MSGRHLVLLVSILAAGVMAIAPEVCAQQMVGLPYVLNDRFGNGWDVQHDGSIGDGGRDLYDGGGHLFINHNQQYHSNQPAVQFDPTRNEVLFPPVTMGGLRVSRRVAVFKELGCCRFVEIIENPGAQSARVNVRAYFNLGGSVQQATVLEDEKKKGQRVGIVVFDRQNVVAMIGAARGAKVVPQFQYMLNSDQVNLVYTLDVPPQQTIALVHFQLRGNGASVADVWRSLKDRDLIRDLPKDLQRKLVNWPAGEILPADLEILRGDTMDVVELRSGDRCRGNLKLESLNLATLFGPMSIRAKDVQCVINVGRYRPSQLVVTNDGDVFAGRLDQPVLAIQLASGQNTTIPLAQVSRVGMRRQGLAEFDESSLENQPIALFRDNGRLRIAPPARNFGFATALGALQIPPGAIGSILFEDGEITVPELRLVDGSRLSALSSATALELQLLGPAPAGRSVRAPTNCLSRIFLRPQADLEKYGSTLRLSNQDLLVGTITGTLSLQTPFDTIHVEAAQVKRLSRLGENQGSEQDVQITLWDDSVLSGRLNESHLSFALKCGLALRVPVGLIGQYDQPIPFPSDHVIKTIREIARDLDSDEFVRRENAQRQIILVGPPAMSVLQQMRRELSAEAGHRVNAILYRLQEQLEGKSRRNAVPMVGPDFNGDGIPDVVIE